MERRELEIGGVYAWDPGHGRPVVPVVVLDRRAWEDARGCALGSDAREDVQAANGGLPLGLARAGCWKPRTATPDQPGVGALVAYRTEPADGRTGVSGAVPGLVAPSRAQGPQREAHARALADMDQPVLLCASASETARKLLVWHAVRPEGVEVAVVMPHRILMEWGAWSEAEWERIRRRNDAEKARVRASEDLEERSRYLEMGLADLGLQAAVQPVSGGESFQATVDAEALHAHLTAISRLHQRLEEVEALRAGVSSDVVHDDAEHMLDDVRPDGGH